MAGLNPDTGNGGEKMVKHVLNPWLCHGSTVAENTTHKLKMAGLNHDTGNRGEKMVKMLNSTLGFTKVAQWSKTQLIILKPLVQILILVIEVRKW
jgi:hypothetical protein